MPYDSGKHEMSMGKGPGKILSNNFEEKLSKDGYDITKHIIIIQDEKQLTDIQSAFRINAILSKTVAETIKSGRFPIILAGNCISSVGALSGIHDKQIKVLWLDAHGDYNTPETTMSGYLDGMALAIACGRCWKRLSSIDPLYQIVPEDQVVLLGARDIDPEEAQALQTSKIKLITPDTVRNENYTIPELNVGLLNKVYIHFDADVIDKSIGQANQFAVPKGLLPNEIINIVRWSAVNSNIIALAVTAYSPEHDSSESICEVIRETIAAILKQLSSRRELTT